MAHLDANLVMEGMSVQDIQDTGYIAPDTLLSPTGPDGGAFALGEVRRVDYVHRQELFDRFKVGRRERELQRIQNLGNTARRGEG